MPKFLDDLVGRQKQGEQFDWEAMLEMVYCKWIGPGDTVLDIGAHLGRHTFPLLQCVGPTGRVYAFEPLPMVFRQLSARLNRPNAILVNAAAAAEDGTATFVHAQGTPGESGFKQRIYNNPDQARPVEITVKTVRVDDLVPADQPVQFIKIDVEGGEFICLASCERIIGRDRPVISVEYGWPAYNVYGHKRSDMHDYVTARDYKIFDLFYNDISDAEVWNQACDSLYWDFVLVPAEKSAEFLKRAGRDAST